jgi:hypothetical protein
MRCLSHVHMFGNSNWKMSVVSDCVDVSVAKLGVELLAMSSLEPMTGPHPLEIPSIVYSFLSAIDGMLIWKRNSRVPPVQSGFTLISSTHKQVLIYLLRPSSIRAFRRLISSLVTGSSRHLFIQVTAIQRSSVMW